MKSIYPKTAFLRFLLVVLISGHCYNAASEVQAGAIPADARSIGGGLSVGTNLDKSADFWGWTIDYGMALDNGWAFTFSMAYDKETEEQTDKPDKITQSYTPTLIWAKPLSPRWSVFAGIAKGLLDDSDKKDSFKLQKLDEDWGTGVGLSYLLYRTGPHALSVSGTLEYKINDGEFAISTDLGYAYFF